MGRSRLDKTRPKSREPGWCHSPSSHPLPHLCPSGPKGNPAVSGEVTRDLCFCLNQGSQTRLGSYPTSLSRGGRQCHHWCLLARHTCAERLRATKRGVLRAQAGPSKELRVPGCDLEQTTAGLCSHTALARQWVPGQPVRPRAPLPAASPGALAGTAPLALNVKTLPL